jgi:chlorite dismutase
MPNHYYVNILALSFNSEWWKLSELEMNKELAQIEEALKKFIEEKEIDVLRIFNSLRYDNDLIFWIIANDTNKIIEFQRIIKKNIGKYSNFKHGFLSILEPSPYFKGELKPFNKEPKRYFIAYPMKRDPEWFLLSEEERKKIVEEHIRIAATHPENKGIISYTSYSFGIDDNEYVVFYELDSLVSWSHVVEKLREAKHRKWVLREEPILVGELYKFLA